MYLQHKQPNLYFYENLLLFSLANKTRNPNQIEP